MHCRRELKWSTLASAVWGIGVKSMAQATLLSRIALGAGAALIIGTAAYAQTPATRAGSGRAGTRAAIPRRTATITTPGYPGVGPADAKLRVVGLPGGKKVHLLPATLETTQWGWFDNAQAPVLRVNSGDTVVLETMMHSHNQVVPGTTIEQIKKLRTDFPGRGPHTFTGPIYIEEAQPGDVLKVTLNKIVPRAYATNFNVPGMFGQFPNRLSGWSGQISLSRPRQDADRVPARHRASAQAVPGHARGRAQGTRPLFAACRPANTPATWTSATSSPARRCMCRCMCRERCCGPATPTPARAMARSTSPRSRPPTRNSTSRWKSSRASRSTSRASRRRNPGSPWASTRT